MSEPTTDYLLSDSEVELFEAWLEDNADAPPCLVDTCDQPGAHRWTWLPCGHSFDLCTEHHTHTLQFQSWGWVGTRGQRLSCGGCTTIITDGTHRPI
jgi:hypothetical protein